MKHFSLVVVLFSTLLQGQNNFKNYEELWAEVEKLESEALPKSALEKVDYIYQLAKKEQNSPQIVKTLLVQSKFIMILEEESQFKIVKTIEKEISESTFPTQNILESILGNLYWQYFQQNRWRYYNRTQTDENVNPTDFRVWDLTTLFKEIQLHFERSLANENELQQTDLSAFESILLEGNESKKFRPTLYDFLVHQALDFYKKDETHLTKPAYKFELDDPNLLSGASEFSSLKLETKDTLSLQFNALKWYQKLTIFHLKDADPSALVMLDMDRISFVSSHATFPNLDEVLLQSLVQFKNKFQNHPSGTMYDAKMAYVYYAQSSKYSANTGVEHQWKLKKAMEICENAITSFPDSYGSSQCKELQSIILQPSLELTTEEFVSVNKPSRVLIQYKNLETLEFKILKITEKQGVEIASIYNDSIRLSKLNRLPKVTTWTTSLKTVNDFQMHGLEMMIPAMEQGMYMVMATHPGSEMYGYTIFQVTDLALVELNSSADQRMQIVDRNNGSPILGASVHLKNSGNSRYDKSFDKTFVTDANGFIYLPKNDYYHNIKATVKSGKKTAVFGNYYISQKYISRNNNRNFNQVFIFTDRSIYRPGQKVFFKGIVIKRIPDGKMTLSNVVSNTKVQAVLKDVNWQEVGKMDLITNEFGSVSGEFSLPENGLTGRFQIQITGNNDNINGNTDFSVEEYKRPKFETTFKPITETYKVNDSVKVTGTALAYAGSNITDAKVVYSVHRKVQYPRWWYWRMPSYQSEPQEITHGETTTNEKGEYEIIFTAHPDQSVQKESLPIFQLEIKADVTDINGETHSATTIVQVGYHSMTADIQTSDQWNTETKEQKITLVSQNLNGENVPATGTLKIYKLQAPKQVKRPRPWQAPDFQMWTEVEFNKLFPNDYYENEGNENEWRLGKNVFSETFENKDKPTEIILKKEFKNWESGKYQMILETKDKFGTEITEKSNFDLSNPKDQKVAGAQMLQVSIDKTLYLPGENVVVKIGSASPNAAVMVIIKKDQKIVKTIPVQLHNEVKTIEIPTTEKDLGGFGISYHLVNFNSFDSGKILVNVAKPIENLSIETLSFRDKMQPGSEQTWSFTLKGLQKDQKTAELLASMYDASLDQFKNHQWRVPHLPLYQSYRNVINANANGSFRNSSFRIYNISNTHKNFINTIEYDRMNWFGFSFGDNLYKMLQGEVAGIRIRGAATLKDDSNQEWKIIESPILEEISLNEDSIYPGFFSPSEFDKELENDTSTKPDFSDVKIRTNFNETAFFFPQIKTDAQGNVTFSFTSPEVLTRWKLQLLGHTQDMKSASYSATSLTQKDLMLLPNPPRFLREGDEIIFSSKISNLSENALNGVAMLELTDAVSGKNVDVKLANLQTTQSFQIDAKGNTSVSWTLQIPYDVQAVQYKIVAKAGDFSDGEQNVLPVLSNRMLVTETLPMWINSNETKTFTLDKLKNNTSTTLQNHKLTLEVTSNPVWYAIQALPYLMEYPYECSEQTFSRYYANALATKIVNDNPKIKAVFDQWENSDALLSNLEKNEELKSLLIAETPWLRDAQNETEQKKRIALLFDLKKMTKELEKSANKLYEMQMNNGGFPWFKGSRYPDRYITQHIAAGFGHLEKLGVFPLRSKSLISFNEGKKTHEMLTKSIGFLDNELIGDYRALERQAQIILDTTKDKKKAEKAVKDFWNANHLGMIQLHYLYTRTFYTEIAQDETLKKVMDYYTNQAYQYWKDYSLYQKGFIALVANRNGKTVVSQAIVKSLDENSITHPEFGMYWKENTSSWYWYQAPIETQALMIETFAEVKPVQNQLDQLKVWLLKNKQTNRWQTTKSTTEAVYALLAFGTDWTKTDDLVEVKVGNQNVIPTVTEVGTGYFKTSWNATEIKPEQATVTLVKKDEGIAWGGLYWQYFEDLDKITFAETPLQLSKKLFIKKNTDTGEKLFEIKENTEVKVGDLVRVRIELKVDREMDFVHMKDMRASGFEPINVLSEYKYQDGLGYYESTKDAATNFFFSNLNKGIYVFEYDLRANNAGDFSNGITSIQCMYAPEFTSHSEGIRVKIRN